MTSVGRKSGRGPASETAVDYLKDWLISHTLLEDLQYRDFFAARGISLSRPGRRSTERA